MATKVLEVHGPGSFELISKLVRWAELNHNARYAQKPELWDISTERIELEAQLREELMEIEWTVVDPETPSPLSVPLDQFVTYEEIR